jgi:trimethylamine:corrinoid methyltransferase-like protein
MWIAVAAGAALLFLGAGMAVFGLILYIENLMKGRH